MQKLLQFLHDDILYDADDVIRNVRETKNDISDIDQDTTVGICIRNVFIDNSDYFDGWGRYAITSFFGNKDRSVDMNVKGES